MRIAYINNHNSAANFFAQMFTNSGYDFWMPLICNEVGSLNGYEASQLRRINISPELLTNIDQINFYSSESYLKDTEIEVFDKYFDLVILIGSTRFTPMIQLALHCKCQIIIYEWGDINGIALHHEYFPAYNRKNVNLVTQFKYSNNSYIKAHLPLGLNPSIFDYKSHEKYSCNSTGIIISGIAHNSYSSNVIKNITKKASNKEFEFYLLGKNNYIDEDIVSFSKNWGSFHFMTNLTIREIYSKVNELLALIYPITESAMMQYSPIESIYLGTPVIYSSHSLIAKLVKPTICQVESFDQVCQALNQLRSKDLRLETIQNQRLILDYFLTAKDLWLNFINKQFCL